MRNAGRTEERNFRNDVSGLRERREEWGWRVGGGACGEVEWMSSQTEGSGNRPVAAAQSERM